MNFQELSIVGLITVAAVCIVNLLTDGKEKKVEKELKIKTSKPKKVEIVESNEDPESKSDDKEKEDKPENN